MWVLGIEGGSCQRVASALNRGTIYPAQNVEFLFKGISCLLRFLNEEVSIPLVMFLEMLIVS